MAICWLLGCFWELLFFLIFDVKYLGCYNARVFLVTRLYRTYAFTTAIPRSNYIPNIPFYTISKHSGIRTHIIRKVGFQLCFYYTSEFLVDFLLVFKISLVFLLLVWVPSMSEISSGSPAEKANRFYSLMLEHLVSLDHRYILDSQYKRFIFIDF